MVLIQTDLNKLKTYNWLQRKAIIYLNPISNIFLSLESRIIFKLHLISMVQLSIRQVVRYKATLKGLKNCSFSYQPHFFPMN